jgi:hypothetical protein
MPATPTQTLADDLLNRLDSVILEAERLTKPLELDPYRSQLFELFVIADASGLMREGATPDLSADGVSARLAERWGLKSAAQQAQQHNTKMSAEHLSKMRLLWSFLRMWMEWEYAWSRWSEFHDRATTRDRITSSAESS